MAPMAFAIGYLFLFVVDAIDVGINAHGKADNEPVVRKARNQQVVIGTTGEIERERADTLQYGLARAAVISTDGEVSGMKQTRPVSLLESHVASVAQVAGQRTQHRKKALENLERELTEHAAHTSCPAGGCGPFAAQIRDLLNDMMIPAVQDCHTTDQDFINSLIGGITMHCPINQTAAFQLEALYNQSAEAHWQCRLTQATKKNHSDECAIDVLTKKALMDAACSGGIVNESLCEPGTGESYEEWVERMEVMFTHLSSNHSISSEACENATKIYNETKANCDNITADWEDKKIECDQLAKDMDHAACTWASKEKDLCHDYNLCYGAAVASYNDATATLLKQEADRKTEWTAIKRIDCLLNVFATNSSDTDASFLTTCHSLVVNTSHLDLVFPPVPPPEPCAVTDLYGCTAAYVAANYLSLPANAPGNCTVQCSYMLA